MSCPCCSHAKAHELNERLVRGVAPRAVATEFAVQERSVRHHQRNHLPALLVKAGEARERLSADVLFGKLQDMTERIERLLNEATDPRVKLLGERELRETLKLVAQLLGELKEVKEISYVVIFDAGQPKTIPEAEYQKQLPKETEGGEP